jgi:hypothetical protein
MGRVRGVDVGGTICHALNRANCRPSLYMRAAHYEDFLGTVEGGLTPFFLIRYK